ncbi:hypothetical protein M2650_04750 [Luteimonas sp. SX5]|uniref:DUF4149 domain-containing protein n=1 Tax=Luteimonas galliterrae TaxID=2940486 RepID=A0ABT0MGG1_9GAMM|nr:hypothetical protein [Luteimonas galliterrae]MCL1633952.1 hypothetical protein [Luteimonas galliterrae]
MHNKMMVRFTLITMAWLIGAYCYFVALLPTFGASEATQKVHAVAAAVAFSIVGLAFCTPAYHRMLITGDWKARVKNPQLSIISAVLLCGTLVLMAAYFSENGTQGSRNAIRFHGLTGLFSYFGGRWIYKR